MSEVGIRIDRVVTRGSLEFSGRSIELENNVWIVGDDEEVVVIDAAHDAEAIVGGVDGRRVSAILLTHGHWDHINMAPELSRLLDAPLHLHPDDGFLWDGRYDGAPDHALVAGGSIEVAGISLSVIHTPGHTPGSVSFSAPALGTVFTGDTLFNGGPGATRWEYSSFPQIMDSINGTLFSLPHEFEAFPGHGDTTTLADEHTRLRDWVGRGCRGPVKQRA
ncbi:MBL fold metallo-hydrolase [Leucobacter sp. GX24907]